ncbi:MAG: hypothetical protein ACO35C_06120 [Pontimonas sp.]|jgi:hypothetical protein
MEGHTVKLADREVSAGLGVGEAEAVAASCVSDAVAVGEAAAAADVRERGEHRAAPTASAHRLATVDRRADVR